MARLSVSPLQMRHDVVLIDPNIPPKWSPDFVEEMHEVLDFVRKMREEKGDS